MAPMVLFLHLLLPLLLFCPHLSIAISDRDLQFSIAVLKTNHRDLFANGILASDIRYKITSGDKASYTLLAPPNPDVFSLDLVSKGSVYVNTLRRHVVLGSLSITDLRRLPIGSSLRTLIPGVTLSVGRRNGSEVVTIDGVAISMPDLYLSSEISIQGLESVLAVGSAIDGGNSNWRNASWHVVGGSSRSSSPDPKSHGRSSPPAGNHHRGRIVKNSHRKRKASKGGGSSSDGKHHSD